MSPADKVDRICRALESRDEPGTPTQVARLLGCSPSTVLRWKHGESSPRGRQADSLDLLYRTVVEADDGNADATKILGSLLGAAGAGLLGLGVGGILIAAGLGWILSGQGNDDEDGEGRQD